MARMHTRRRGRSKSHRPVRSTAQMWVTVSKDEIEAIVEKLAREGRKEAEIGLILRDQHGVPSIKMIAGKTISQLLKEKGMQPKYPSDLIDLIRKAVRMRKHMGNNKKDKLNSKQLVHVEAKIKRLANYYRGKKLPKDWKYDPAQAALLVK
ncbi:MAG TPA: 30S ribosomal protein S15 [Candidatus Norongarragalinales archaeon]|nr:30S ribosomal protein S15 [Candidatus Norongarragalinales archaeon]